MVGLSISSKQYPQYLCRFKVTICDLKGIVCKERPKAFIEPNWHLK
jgi:hypothetical protein